MKIEKIKKSGKKYKIILSNGDEITTYDDVILNYNLLYHKDIDYNLLNKINNDNDYYEIYYKTVNYITKRLRSEKEILNYIDKNNVTNSNKEKIINKLKETNLINDLNYTKAYISDKINLSNNGLDKIKKELLMHDIPCNIIDEELSKVDVNLIKDKLSKLINKKIKNSKYTGNKLKLKTINDLINLGYDRSEIIDVYDSINVNNNLNIKKEYEKLYKKYSNKYKDKQLEIKIKSNLYNLGFSVDEINNILDDHNI